MPRFPFLALVLAAGIPLAAGIASCTAGPAKGLMIAIQTDLSVTKDFDKLGLYITVDGTPVFANEYPFDTDGKVRLPSSLALRPTDNAAAVVRVRAVAFRKGEARVLRQAITTIPSDRAALLRMPLEWLAAGTSTKGTEGDYIANPFAHGLNLCPSNDQTSDKGLCVTSSFPVGTLPDYSPADVFGGGDESGAGASCFDVGACFAARVALVPDAGCTVPFAGSAAGLNVAVATSTGEGELVGGDSLVVQNQSAWTLSNGRIQLPLALCQAPKNAEVKAVVLSTACATKTEKFPICGPFSMGKPLPLLGDAGPLPIVDGGADGGLPLIEDFGSTEPDVGTVVVGTKYIYAVGSDPQVSTNFRLIGFEKAGSSGQAPAFILPLSGKPVTRLSAAVAMNAGNVVVVQSLPDVASGALDVFPLVGGFPGPPASSAFFIENPAVALSPQSIFYPEVTDSGIGKRPFSDPTTPAIPPAGVNPHHVTALRFVDSPPVVYVGTQDGWLFRVDDPDAVQSFAVPLLTAADTGGFAIGGIAVAAGGTQLVLSMPAPTGPAGEIITLSSSVPDGGIPDGGAVVTVLSSTEDLSPSNDVHATRYRGVGADAKYAYFATAGGVRYVPLDASGPSKSLKDGSGVFGIDVDLTHVYWTAMDDAKPTALHKGIGRALLIP